MCSAHHDPVDRGISRLEGTAPDRIVVKHADAPVCVALRASETDRADAVDGLRRMGVPAGDARRAVDAAVTAGAVPIEDILRQAPRVLGQTTYASCVTRVAPASAAS